VNHLSYYDHYDHQLFILLINEKRKRRLEQSSIMSYTHECTIIIWLITLYAC